MATKTKRKPAAYGDQRSATKDDADLGLRIRLRRIEIDMSQTELGNHLGVTFQQVQKYEKGVNRVSASRFLETCRVLKVDPNYLLGWEGKPFRADEMQVNDSNNLRVAQAINSLPAKLRAPVLTMIRSLGDLTAADLK